MDYISKDTLNNLPEEDASPLTALPFELVNKIEDDEPTIEMDMRNMFETEEVEVLVPVKAKVFRRGSGVHSYVMPCLSDIEDAVKTGT